jgi:hypothetical protein
MSREEQEFTRQVTRALQAAGFEVKPEVRVRGRRRLDLVATKDKVIRGIEVKLDRRGLLDDLVKAQSILHLPDVDEMYVCGPKVFMSQDVRSLAARLGIGLLALTDAGELGWLTESKRLEPARLALSGAYVNRRDKMPFNAVRPGGKAVWNVAVFNNGGKTAVNVEVFMVPAGPFVARVRSKARVKKALLERSGPVAWSTLLECEVKKGTPPGTYPLMISVTADNAPRDDHTVLFEVVPQAGSGSRGSRGQSAER